VTTTESAVAAVLVATRAITHGDFPAVARAAQRIKAVIGEELSAAGNVLAPAQAEALDQIATKLARIVAGNPDFRDH
jgi:hypothetical protein